MKVKEFAIESLVACSQILADLGLLTNSEKEELEQKLQRHDLEACKKIERLLCGLAIRHSVDKSLEMN